MQFYKLYNLIFENEKDQKLDKKFIEKVDDISVYTVNGNYVRTKIDEEFTDFAQHGKFEKIPEKEFWIDNITEEKEYKFFIDHMMREYLMMKNGSGYPEALDSADKLEQHERDKEEHITNKGFKNKEDVVEKIHYKQYEEFKTDGFKIWLINGEVVREFFDIDFTEGGHGYVYQFCPKDEIWLEKTISKDEIKYILLHESNERNRMKNDEWNYEKAHKESSKIEYEYRHLDDEEKIDKKIQSLLEAQ